MKKFIGDLSKQDAELLERYARGSRRILEFGVGGSTQIIAQSIFKDASFISIDTSPEWIERTRENLRRLGVEDRCRMMDYNGLLALPGLFDLIFNDGAGSYRLDFAVRTFPLLAAGGVMLFHDTRRIEDMKNALGIVEHFFEEIESVHLNERVGLVSSNITVVRKKTKESYVNWNAVEGKKAWQLGYEPVPESFWKG